MLNLIVSSKWLHTNLNDSNLIILDASFKNNKTAFENIRIKGTKYFDIKNEFSDTTSPFPNTLLSPEKFEIASQKLGINKKSKIIVYDNLGIYTSPRVWWLLKIMGHKNVAILNGGLPDWVNNDFETEKIKSNTNKLGDFKVKFNAEQVVHFNFMKGNNITKNAIVIDVRSSDRFHSLVPEKRKGLRSGNLPNSINIPYQNVLENGKYKSKKELTKLFSKFVTNEKPLVFSCGSGITACIVFLASELVLENKKAVYDGSWTEYGQKTEEEITEH